MECGTKNAKLNINLRIIGKSSGLIGTDISIFPKPMQPLTLGEKSS
jgi:hypothetical protein